MDAVTRLSELGLFRLVRCVAQYFMITRNRISFCHKFSWKRHPKCLENRIYPSFEGRRTGIKRRKEKIQSHDNVNISIREKYYVSCLLNQHCLNRIIFLSVSFAVASQKCQFRVYWELTKHSMFVGLRKTCRLLSFLSLCSWTPLEIL